MSQVLHCPFILPEAFNSLLIVLTIKQLNSELQEICQFLVCIANMNEVLGMNVINKFAESLGMPTCIIKLNMNWQL